MFYMYSINYMYSVNIIIINHSLSGTYSTSYILHIFREHLFSKVFEGENKCVLDGHLSSNSTCF